MTSPPAFQFCKLGFQTTSTSTPGTERTTSAMRRKAATQSARVAASAPTYQGIPGTFIS